MPRSQLLNILSIFLPQPWAAGIRAALPTRLKQLWLLQDGFGNARVQLASFVLRQLLRITRRTGSPVQALVSSLVLYSRPDAAEKARQDQEMGNPALRCAAQLGYHTWEHQATSQKARLSDAARDVASRTISCSLTGEAGPVCLPSAPGCANL